jgi:hypothetical protein
MLRWLIGTLGRSHGTPIVDQDQVAHSPSGQSEPEDLGYIVRWEDSCPERF